MTRDKHSISPLVYGMTGGTPEGVSALRPTLLSWGGNASSRFNWRNGHAWNAGRDWFYRNGNYGSTVPSASNAFIELALAHGSEVRLAVPTLGWVAKDDNNDTCSFPLPEGGCGDAGGATCEAPGAIADPALANVRSDVNDIVAWVQYLREEQGYAVRFIAMDNEPELWGYTHYDVHPWCTTYAEILEQYLTYATAIRAVAPEAELVGPNTCCWHLYWNSAAGEADKAQHGGADFLPWFLDEVRAHDEQLATRTLDVLDVHYYPEGLYNDDVDPATAAHRLRSTRSLWDAAYADESWISGPVALIPRLQRLLEAHYPGTRLGISEWNWGAGETQNGALAIADVLGILGREQVYYAAYWGEPLIGSPAFYAFKLYTNYDDQGGRFGDLSVWSQSEDVDVVASHAALDSATGHLHLILINKLPDRAQTVQVDLQGFVPAAVAQEYRLTQAEPSGITRATRDWAAQATSIDLPPYSVTLLIFTAE